MEANHTSLEILQKMVEGSHKISEVLRPTLGPEGRNVFYDQELDIDLIVNDGKSILPNLILPDQKENIGASLVRKSGELVGSENGDGTSSTVLMTDALLQRGYHLIASGINPIQLRKELETLEKAVQKEIKSCAVTPDSKMLAQVAAIAADDDKIGNLVAESFEMVLPDGVITVTDSQEPFTRVEQYKDVRYESGLYHTGFITNPVFQRAELEEPYILLVNYKLSSLKEIEKILSEIIHKNSSLLIIAQDIGKDLLNLLLFNKAKHGLKIAVGKAPGYGDARRLNLEALAAKTGATVIEENCGLTLSQCGTEICGKVREARLDNEATILSGFLLEDSRKIAFLQQYTHQLLNDETDTFEREKLETTLSILSGKSAKIIAGGMVEQEMFEQKHKAENALSAVKSTKKLGVVPGGGRVYLSAVSLLKSMQSDDNVIKQGAVLCMTEALISITKNIAENAGYNGDIVVQQILAHSEDPWYGFNAVSGKYGNLKESGILDSADTACLVVQTAVSTAATLLTAGAVVY